MESGAELDEIRGEIIKSVSKVCCNFGINDSVAKIWSYLLFTNEPKSLEEIAEDNEYALSTTSANLKLLEALGDVERFRLPRDKRVYYRITESLDKKMESFISNIIENEIRPIIDVMGRAEEKLGRMSDTPEVRVYRERVKNMRKTTREMERKISMMVRFAKMKRSVKDLISKKDNFAG